MLELLLSLILSLTGIPRDVDPRLAALAQDRAVEIQTDFSHAGQPCCWEVLAWNSGYPDPIPHAVEQWRGSPTHWAILSDPSLTRIGCGISTAGDRTYVACILDRAVEPEGAARSPKPTPAGSTPAGGATLPDTAMVYSPGE